MNPKSDTPGKTVKTEKPHWLDLPRNQKQLWRGFLALLGFSLLAEWFVPLHPAFEIESWFAFAAWFGFAACILMIVGAKCLALLLKRRDSYYADHASDHPHRDD